MYRKQNAFNLKFLWLISLPSFRLQVYFMEIEIEAKLLKIKMRKQTKTQTQ